MAYSVYIDRGENKEKRVSITVEPSSYLKYIFIFKEPIEREIELRLKEGSEGYIYGAFIGKNDDLFNITTATHHLGKNTKGFTKIKGVLYDKARSDYKGLIKIEKAAQLTNAFLEERVLLLGDDARAQAKPDLEIEADDVKASHAASAGKIDPEQIFYLESRGIPRVQAEQMIVDGFLEEIIREIYVT